MTDEQILKPTENIKLMKMAKQYQWEIKLIHDDEQSDKELVDRMEQLNNDMIKRFGEL